MDNYQGKINRRAHSFVQLTQNSIHLTQRRPDRLKHILNSWKMLTRDQGILSVGYKIPVSTRARQKKIPWNIHMTVVQERLVDMEISEMLTRGAISVVQKDHKKGFLSNIFPVGEPDWCCCPVINPKKLSKHMLYQQFNMEDLSKMHVATGRLHVQARFKKDAYFLVPLSKESRKMIPFQWTGNL